MGRPDGVHRAFEQLFQVFDTSINLLDNSIGLTYHSYPKLRLMGTAEGPEPTKKHSPTGLSFESCACLGRTNKISPLPKIVLLYSMYVAGQNQQDPLIAQLPYSPGSGCIAHEMFRAHRCPLAVSSFSHVKHFYEAFTARKPVSPCL